MRLFIFGTVGVIFGIVLAKAEVISWFRIQEMFRFQSFHMFGVIMSAIITLALLFAISKRLGLKAPQKEVIKYPIKNMGWKNYLFGGVIFGIGWALTGACPGPLFILVGQGYWVFLIVIASATIGTFTYGVLKNKLPH